MSSKSRIYAIILVIIIIIAVIGVVYFFYRGDDETLSHGTFVYNNIFRYI
ncbi:MAG: hypothetical protein K0R15_2069 [Clostridiales bacterium]|jgi:flagellar basal body-associated protein FliL|nr:hypothetical protein [Clostridiales bacterium]